MNYYYLAAVLPSLAFGEPPPMSADDFIALCSEHLTGSDFSAVKGVLVDGVPEGDNSFTREWHRRETVLRNAVVRARAARLQTDPAPFLRDDGALDTAAERAVADAYSKKTPLERERALDLYRWRQAEEMAGFDPFTARAIIAYALRFALCLRWKNIDREKGENEAEALLTRQASATAANQERTEES